MSITVFAEKQFFSPSRHNGCEKDVLSQAPRRVTFYFDRKIFININPGYDALADTNFLLCAFLFHHIVSMAAKRKQKKNEILSLANHQREIDKSSIQSSQQRLFEFFCYSRNTCANIVQLTFTTSRQLLQFGKKYGKLESVLYKFNHATC